MLQRFVIILTFCLPLSVFAAGKIYTWTDDYGVVHYGDRPPLEVNAEEIAIQGKKKEPVVIVKEQIPGTWFGSVNDGGEIKITLNESGAMTFLQTKADQSVYNFQGVWTLEEQTITVITEFSQTAPANGEFKRSIEPVQLNYNIIAFSESDMELISGEERFELTKTK